MPLPDIGLFASRFERRALHAADVEFELLLHPRHSRNVALFAEAADALAARVEERFSAAEEASLGYPYESLSLVEVPAQLRTYGGGWKMDTVLSLPGIMLMRESGFPTSRFERQFRDPKTLAEMEGEEGGIAAAKVRVLERFLRERHQRGQSVSPGYPATSSRTRPAPSAMARPRWISSARR